MYDIDYTKSSQVSSLEGQVLSQYQFLASQLNVLSLEISLLTVKASEDQGESKVSGSAHNLSENLRNLEMKIGLIHTLFKGAVYTLFLEQDQEEEQKEEEEDVASEELS